jgi:predicted PurR-regulated permease PerM
MNNENIDRVPSNIILYMDSLKNTKMNISKLEPKKKYIKKTIDNMIDKIKNVESEKLQKIKDIVNIFGSIILMTLICLYVFKYYIFV